MSEQPARTLAPGRYLFDDLAAGDRFAVGGLTVTEAHVVMFAGVSGDHYPLHMDDEAGRAAGFPGRIAHGLLGLALVDGLFTRCPVMLEAVAALGWSWQFRQPLLIGERIAVEAEVASLRRTRRAERGIAVLQLVMRGRAGTVIAEGEKTMMMPARTA